MRMHGSPSPACMHLQQNAMTDKAWTDVRTTVCRVWDLGTLRARSGLGAGGDNGLEERRNWVDPVGLPGYHARGQPHQPLTLSHHIHQMHQVRS